jgi:hypothetical protein
MWPTLRYCLRIRVHGLTEIAKSLRAADLRVENEMRDFPSTKQKKQTHYPVTLSVTQVRYFVGKLDVYPKINQYDT